MVTRRNRFSPDRPRRICYLRSDLHTVLDHLADVKNGERHSARNEHGQLREVESYQFAVLAGFRTSVSVRTGTNPDNNKVQLRAK